MNAFEREEPLPAGEQKYRELLAKFIRQAHAFEVASSMYAQYVENLDGTPGAFSPEMVVQSSAFEVARNMALVNDCVRELGGIAFSPPGINLPQPLTLISWHGFDPNHPDHHLWEAQEMPGSAFSVPEQDMELIERTLLGAAEPYHPLAVQR